MLNFFQQIFFSFSSGERRTFIASFLILSLSLISAAFLFIQTNTELIPASGGVYTEGITGQPTFLNPVLASLAGPDSDINAIIFLPLKDLTDNYLASSDKKTINLRLKDNIFWQDGQPITSDDLIYTIKAIQNNNLGSPLSSSWQGVSAERISSREIKLVMLQPYSFFQNIVLSLRPIPKHIFENIPLANLKLSDYNLEPISDGPFKFSSLNKRRDGFITQYDFVRNDRFSGTPPYLDKIVLKFYKNADDLIQAFNSGDIDGFGSKEPLNLSRLSLKYRLNEIALPRYYAVFFNPQNNPLFADQNLRLAINYAVDKKRIIKEALNDSGFPISGPILIKDNPEALKDFSPEKSKELLENAGWRRGDDGIYKKIIGNKMENLEFTLTTYPADFLLATAKILQENWQAAGIKANLASAGNNFEEDIVKSRHYDALLFGNTYGLNPDPYSFWHSSQKFYPGFNLSFYEDKSADNLIDTIRSEFNEEKKSGELNQLESLITQTQPAIFLYSPYYLYTNNGSLKGWEEKSLSLPADRFLHIENWYLKTSRRFRN